MSSSCLYLNIFKNTFGEIRQPQFCIIWHFATFRIQSPIVGLMSPADAKSQWQNECVVRIHCMYHQDFALGQFTLIVLESITF